jgi:mannose-6-phosphate isomerase-like protein (cupin superfamily)
MIKYVQLAHRFNVTLLQQEVKQLETAMWTAHYNIHDYNGGWTVLPLRSINGMADNSIAIHSASLQKDITYQDTIYLDQCDYLQSVLRYFECEKTAVRLMKLNPGSNIKAHCDLDLNFEEGEVRFHVPVFTNPSVEFFLEEEKIPMGEGECWYLNLSLQHRVNNFGESNRIHLVIDCKVNSWMEKLLSGPAEKRMDFTPAEKKWNHSDADKTRIIQELRQMATPASIALADQMAREIN